MEQFRQVGEALGSMKALMVFRNAIQINQRQCTLLLDIFTSAYDLISEEMRMKLNFEERNTRWHVLEQPFRDLHRVFKDAEMYIKQCLESRDWWSKAITLYHNTDCIEFHFHNLLSCVPIVIEATEIASEVSGWDADEMNKRRLLHATKYKIEWTDPELFRLKFGKQYVVAADFCSRIDTAWEEDRWILLNKIKAMKNSGATKHERRLMNLLSTNLQDGSEQPSQKLLSSSILVGSKDYQVRQRLGTGAQYKEIMWLGESFALRHFMGDIETLVPEISSLLSLSHPNVMHYLCGFTDDEKRECFLVMELMNKTLHMHIREICGPRKKNTISLPVAVDLMLQIARGMEYLHSKKIFHGDLNPSNILVKPRWNNSSEAYLQAKVSGFGLNSIKGFTTKSSSNQNEPHSFIWHCPEVLEEQEQTGATGSSKYTEKSDVYSFGMVCFELLTGKVPFEDSHLQGDKMSRNIRAGERPLFPFYSPKYITNLTKRCWHADPNQRPSFSSICRILRYIKRFITLNPDVNSHQEPAVPSVDYSDIETWLSQRYQWDGTALQKVWQIPLQMFAYRVVEKEKTGGSFRETSESGSDRASISGDDNGATSDDALSNTNERRLSYVGKGKSLPSIRRFVDVKPLRQPSTPRTRSPRPPHMGPSGRTMRLNSESQLILTSPRRTFSPGHVSDSELS